MTGLTGLTNPTASNSGQYAGQGSFGCLDDPPRHKFPGEGPTRALYVPADRLGLTGSFAASRFARLSHGYAVLGSNPHVRTPRFSR